MRTQDILLVRRHFAALRGHEDAFSTMFYDRLFSLAPTVRPYFPQDMGDQRRKLMQVLRFAIDHLDRPEQLAPAVISLGARHASYGVHRDHFAPVGVALLDTLAAWLGVAFDAQARSVWTAVFAALADLMQQGMAAAKPAVPAE